MGACTVGFHNGLCCHAVMKADWRIFIKDYRRGKISAGWLAVQPAFGFVGRRKLAPAITAAPLLRSALTLPPLRKLGFRFSGSILLAARLRRWTHENQFHFVRSAADQGGRHRCKRQQFVVAQHLIASRRRVDDAGREH
jgi:hypothetical protein